MTTLRQPDWSTANGDIRLWCDDCLRILPQLEAGSVEHVITDPPFSSGSRQDAGKSVRGSMVRGAQWSDNWFSCDNLATHGFIYLMRMLFVSLLDLSAVSGTLHAFIDWRMYPHIYGAAESSGWVTKNLLVWDKQHFGMGSNYRNQHELVLYCEKGNADFRRHDVGNVLKAARADCQLHPTEKPLDLIETLLECASLPGECSIDPFMGSGTTGVACVRTGRRFIGIEKEERYFEICVKRIEAELRRAPLFEPPPQIVQKSMFNEA